MTSTTPTPHPPHSPRTWEDNAAEFAQLDKGEGWPFARLVACSVEKGRGASTGSVRNDRYGPDGKVSAQKFAERARTSAPRVLRYLKAWEKAADKHWVDRPDLLVPSDAHVISDPDQPWEVVYDAHAAGGRPRDSKAEDAVTIIERRGAGEVIQGMSPELAQEVARELLHRTDAVRDLAAEPEEHFKIQKTLNESEPTRKFDRKMKRWQKETEAKRSESPPVVNMHRALQVALTSSSFTEEVEGSAQTEQGKEVVRLLASSLESDVTRLRAWADGLLEPMSDVQFRDELQALLEEK